MKLKQKIYSLLRWSEKYIQTDMIYLAKGGFWLILGQAISFILGLLLTIAFANLIPKETYGLYKYILSIGSILSITTLPGMSTAVVRAVARGYEGSFIPALKSRLRWGILGILGSLGIAVYYYFLQQNIILALSFLIISIFIPLMYSFNLYASFWSGRKKFEIQSKYNIITQIASILILIITLFLTQNILLIILVYFISYTILKFFFLNLTIKKIRQISNKKEDFKTISYGKHLTLIGIIGVIANQLDKILLWHYLGATSLAIYSLAILPPKQIVETFRFISTLALPKFSQRKTEILKKSLPRKIFTSFFIALPITSIYIALSPFVYKIFFPQYLDSVFYSQIFALIILLQGSMLLITYLNAQMRKKELYIFSFSSSIIKILLIITLIPLYKILGAIIAILIVGLVNFCLLIYLFKKSS